MAIGFPRELLRQSNEDRLAYFEAYTIAHPKLKEATKQTIRFIGHRRAKASCITIFGPTGVGKTTLLQKVEQMLIQEALQDLQTDRGWIPVVMVEAPAPESGSFNWKDFFTRSLATMEEPLIEQKVDYGTRGIYRNKEGQLVIESSVVSAKLRFALENALKHRHPLAFLIDEAQHIQKMASGRRLQDNMDCIKSIANLTQIPHVLVGTYELLTMRNLSGQLSRRNQDIHFSRYRADCQEDVQAFFKVLLTFQRHLSLQEEPDLLSQWEYLYERCLGCIGILKEWLNRAFSDALEEEAATLTYRHLQQRALSITQCKKMIQEIEEGEKALQETVEDGNKLRDRLKLNQEELEGADASEKKTGTDNPSPPKKRKARRVGSPNPKRRKVGGQDSA